MKTLRMLWMAWALISIPLLLQSNQARAQDEEDPPTRVARLNYSSGAVSFQPGGQGDWVTAVQNRPLTTGDNLWADQNSRAELHIGSTAIRMDSETSLTFLDLDDHTTQLRLSLGSLVVRVRHLDDGDLMEIDTPNVAFTIQRTGEYRIDVNQDGNQTMTTVWHGRGEATGGGYSYTVVAGQQAIFNGTDELDHEIAQIPASDDFDNFAFERDAREDHDESANYISAEMTGYEDLDDYGHWHYVADYGPVWTPVGIAPGWAPYRFGHWVWIAPWGWTWVEDEPWGFAPFHYGRWAFVDSSWCWVPGPVVVRPVYAPALVAFVGGGGFHLSVGVGEGVAWFPLGPREVYVPPYRVSRTYVNNVNITNTRVNVTQVTNVYNTYITNNNTTRITYVNQRVPTAVTAVSRETFVNARPVARNLAQVDARQVAQAPVSHEVAMQPARQSVVGAGTVARARPPATVENRRVVATRNPAAPRAPFEQRQAANVHTETPGTPPPQQQPGANMRPGASIAPRAPAPGVVRPENPRPEEARPVPRPAQPAAPTEATRPENPRPPEPSASQGQARPEGERSDLPRPAGNVPHPSQEESRGNNRPPHPLVKPAPPVQQRPQVEQSEANKFRNWQQQRPAPPPRPAPAPRPPANREQGHPPQHQDKNQDKK